MTAEVVDRQERRKRRTRQAIQAAALDLFAERGYRETTINDIAERADVAPRTVTLHFPAKEELLFDAEPFTLESLSKRLTERKPDESALEALRDWMATTMRETDTDGTPSQISAFGSDAPCERTSSTLSPSYAAALAPATTRSNESSPKPSAKNWGSPETPWSPASPPCAPSQACVSFTRAMTPKLSASLRAAAELLDLVDRVIRFAQAGIDGSH